MAYQSAERKSGTSEAEALTRELTETVPVLDLEKREETEFGVNKDECNDIVFAPQKTPLPSRRRGTCFG